MRYAVGIGEDDSLRLLLGNTIVSELTGKPEPNLVAVALSGFSYRLIQPFLARRGREAQAVRVLLVFSSGWQKRMQPVGEWCDRCIVGCPRVDSSAVKL